MFKILLILSISALVINCLNFVSLISNEWYSIYMRNNKCVLNLSNGCLTEDYFKVFTIGLWFMCPTTGPDETTWVFNSNLETKCFRFIAHTKSLVSLKTLFFNK